MIDNSWIRWIEAGVEGHAYDPSRWEEKGRTSSKDKVLGRGL